MMACARRLRSEVNERLEVPIPAAHPRVSRAFADLAGVPEVVLSSYAQADLSGVLSVGVTSLVAGHCVSEVFSQLQRNCPTVQVLVTEGTPQFLEHVPINGELDVAIMVSNTLGEPQAMVAETLTRSQYRVWLPSNHPLAAREELALTECALLDQIARDADPIDALMNWVWGRHQLEPRVIMRNASLEVVRSLVGAGAGIAIEPDFLYRPWTLDAPTRGGAPAPGRRADDRHRAGLAPRLGPESGGQ